MAPVVIIGSGQAGSSVARELRKLDAETPVLMLTEDDGAAYYKPNLSKAFASQKDADSLITADAAAAAAQLKIDIRANAAVSAINVAEKTIEIDGQAQPYRQLVLATGAKARRLAISGNAADRVLSVNNRLDYAAFRAAAAGSKHVTIIGGGLIGCEFANDLSSGGYAVSVVDPLAWPLGTLLPEPAGKALQAGLAGAGVTWQLEQQVEAINHSNGRVEVTLNSGVSWLTDTVLSAVGLVPEISLAEQAGIAVGRGVVVNSSLETSAEGVFALGDCCEINGALLPYIAPILHCARVIAKRLTGESASLSLPAMPVIVKTPACPTIIAPPPAGSKGSWTISGQAPDLECRFESPNGELLGCALLGEASKQRMAYQRGLPAVL